MNCLRFSVATMSNGQHVVLLTASNEQTLLTPEAADAAAERLIAYAQACRATMAMIASRPGALAALLSNPAGRA